jgi:hypothetical protein
MPGRPPHRPRPTHAATRHGAHNIVSRNPAACRRTTRAKPRATTSPSPHATPAWNRHRPRYYKVTDRIPPDPRRQTRHPIPAV